MASDSVIVANLRLKSALTVACWVSLIFYAFMHGLSHIQHGEETFTLSLCGFEYGLYSGLIESSMSMFFKVREVSSCRLMNGHFGDRCSVRCSRAQGRGSQDSPDFFAASLLLQLGQPV